MQMLNLINQVNVFVAFVTIKWSLIHYHAWIEQIAVHANYAMLLVKNGLVQMILVN